MYEIVDKSIRFRQVRQLLLPLVVVTHVVKNRPVRKKGRTETRQLTNCWRHLENVASFVLCLVPVHLQLSVQHDGFVPGE